MMILKKDYICAWLAWKTLGLSLILNDLRIRIENEDRNELKQSSELKQLSYEFANLYKILQHSV